jgi:phospholipase/carboxylesterase
MLKYEIAKAKTRDASRVTAVLLHGRGADRFDLFGLHSRLPQHWNVVAPEAPFPAAPWGYGPGWAWYQFLGRNKPEPNSFSQSLDALHEFVGSLPEVLGEDAGKIVLGGFSQGGTLSLAYALKHNGAVPMIINFSGFLADHPSVVPNTSTVRGTRFFWGHGKQDANIPFPLAIEGRAALRVAGADLDERDYDIGHWIDAQELEDAVNFVESEP